VSDEFDQFILLYRQLCIERDEAEKKVKDLRAEWSDKIELHGPYRSNIGSISLVKPSLRTAYDTHALDLLWNELCVTHPDIAARLESAKKVTSVAGTWRVT